MILRLAAKRVQYSYGINAYAVQSVFALFAKI